MKAHILIDDAKPVYPVFYIGKPGDAAAVEIPASRDQVLKWRSAITIYNAAQREIEALVNTYQPAAIKALAPK